MQLLDRNLQEARDIRLIPNLIFVAYTHAISPNTLRAIPQGGFAGAKILVIGDLMLDQYIDGEVQRISPEAPVPVLSVRKQRFVAGGAANVALNAAGLNAEVTIAGAVGEDPAGQRLRELLSQSGVDTKCILTIPSRPTTTKTRIVSGNHQIVRLDEEILQRLGDEYECELRDRLTACINDVSAVILSDYGKGVLWDPCPQTIIQECRRRAIPVLVDPKRIDYTAYKGATCITPNQKEFTSAALARGIPFDNFNFAGLLFQEQLECTVLLVTQGEGGMTLFSNGQARHLPALAEEVFDVSGAGDTVIGTLASALGIGLPFECAVELANAAASIVVRRAGTTPIVWRDLSEFLDPAGMNSMEENWPLPNTWRREWDSNPR